MNWDQIKCCGVSDDGGSSLAREQAMSKMLIECCLQSKTDLVFPDPVPAKATLRQIQRERMAVRSGYDNDDDDGDGDRRGDIGEMIVATACG